MESWLLKILFFKTGIDSHLSDVQVLVRVVRQSVQGLHREQQQVQEHGEETQIS